MNKLFVINRFLLVNVIILSSVFILGGCNTLVLNNDSETILLLKNVFNETQYYSYNQEAELYRVYDSSKSMIGYAFNAEGMGEEVMTSDGGKIPAPIIILVGLKKDKETINNIYIIEHHESVLFWQLLITEHYFEQFNGLTISDAYFKRDGGKIDAITGATLSAASVLNIVREGTLNKTSLLN
jgi:Na+-translocating ferredoxin:NAD+ oxidoreductase RnfG subunit